MLLIMTLVLVFSVSALEITSPEATTYNSTEIQFSVIHNETLDNINYSIDVNNTILACENCSSYTAVLVLAEGEHVIEVTGYKDNETYDDSVNFTIELPVDYPDFSLEIVSPEDKIYDSTEIEFSTTVNETLDIIKYKIDSGSFVTVCENCSFYNSTLNVSEGEHTLTVKGSLGNKTKTETVDFGVELEKMFTLQIVKPEPKTYEPGLIDLEVSANTTLDKITVKVSDYEESCDNCSNFTDSVNLGEGNYNLQVKGQLGNTEKNVIVNFKVEKDDGEDENDTDDQDNETGLPRFALGYEKLPKLVENDEISDSDLAEIIRNYQLNPGIINRLIKTRKLGNESLQAILDYQKFKPTGIWNKLLAFIGYKGNTYASQIYKNYKLPEKLQQKLVTRDDLPKGLAKKVQQELRVNVNENKPEQKPNKTLKVGKQNKVPPGLAKKQDNPGMGKGKKFN